MSYGRRVLFELILSSGQPEDITLGYSKSQLVGSALSAISNVATTDSPLFESGSLAPCPGLGLGLQESGLEQA